MHDNMPIEIGPLQITLLYSKTGVYRGIRHFVISALEHGWWVLAGTTLLEAVQANSQWLVLDRNPKQISQFFTFFFFFFFSLNSKPFHLQQRIPLF